MIRKCCGLVLQLRTSSVASVSYCKLPLDVQSFFVAYEIPSQRWSLCCGSEYYAELTTGPKKVLLYSKNPVRRTQIKSRIRPLRILHIHLNPFENTFCSISNMEYLTFLSKTGKRKFTFLVTCIIVFWKWTTSDYSMEILFL